MKLYSANVQQCFELEFISKKGNTVVARVKAYNDNGGKIGRFELLHRLLRHDNFVSIIDDEHDVLGMVKNVDGERNGLFCELTFTICSRIYPVSSICYMSQMHNHWLESVNSVHMQIKKHQYTSSKDCIKVKQEHFDLIHNHIKHYLDKTVLDRHTGQAWYFEKLARHARLLFIAKDIISESDWPAYVNTKQDIMPDFDNKKKQYVIQHPTTHQHVFLGFDDVEAYYFDNKRGDIAA